MYVDADDVERGMIFTEVDDTLAEDRAGEMIEMEEADEAAEIVRDREVVKGDSVADAGVWLPSLRVPCPEDGADVSIFKRRIASAVRCALVIVEYQRNA